MSKLKIQKQRAIQNWRALKAILITVGIIMLIPISGFAQEQAQNTTQLTSIMSTIVSQSFGESANSADVGRATDDSSNGNVDIEKLANNMGVKTSKNVPEAFTDECFDVSGKSNLLVDEQGDLISFTASGEAGTAFQDIMQCLEKKGWTSAESGSDTQGTFIKNAGDIRWIYVTCLDVGGETCVVIQTTSASR